MEIDGALIVDKPAGITSAEVVRRMKKQFRFPRIGHGGTLDPQATGMLVILVGKATKLQALILDGTKVYQGVFRFGLQTTSDDLGGAVMFEDQAFSLESPQVDERFAKATDAFTGTVLQRPPAVSAIKVDGQRSYDLARKGELIEHPPRPVEIYHLALERLGPTRMAYRVSCSKGTYVRSLARDLGTWFGTYACLESIRRTSSGSFVEMDMKPLDEILEAPIETNLIPMARLIGELPKVNVDDANWQKLRSGDQRVLANLSLPPNARGELGAALIGSGGEFCGMLEPTSESAEGAWRVRFLV